MPRLRVYQDEAIIIKRTNTGETDRILTLFTRRHGKIRVIAKGVRRITSRRRGHLELFNKAIVSLHQGKSLDIVTEADTAADWRPLWERLDVIGYAYYISELIDRLVPENDPQPELYTAFVGVLTSLSGTDSQSVYQKRLDAFARYLLEQLGFLSPGRTIAEEELTQFIESVIERRLRTPRLMRKIHGA